MTWELADRHGVGEELRVLNFDLKAEAEKSVTLAQLELLRTQNQPLW